MSELSQKLGSNLFSAAQTSLIIWLMVGSFGCFAAPTLDQVQEDSRQFFTESPMTLEFLKMLDEGSYRAVAESPLMYKSNDLEKRVSQFSNLRSGKGRVLKRILAGTSFGRNYKGMPEGEYHGIYYQTLFEDNKSYSESVLLIKIESVWLIVAYNMGESKPGNTELSKQAKMPQSLEPLPVAENFLKYMDGSPRNTFDTPMPRLAFVTKEYVIQIIKNRAAMGKVITRSYASTLPLTEVSGMPDGEYQTILYQTEFENKANSWESVLLNKQGGNWAVVKYHIQ